jgi:protein AaeX
MMWRETNLFGVYISPLVAYMIAAMVVLLPVRLVLIRFGLMRWTWNPALAEAGIYLCILGALVTFL